MPPDDRPTSREPAPIQGPPGFTDPARRARLAGAADDLGAVFAAFRARHEIPGVAFGLVVDGELTHAGGDGVARLGPPPVLAGPHSIFRAASLTKSLTATCVLVLRDRGVLGLDDPVAAHVPEAAALVPPTTDSPTLTLRHLLSMSAGLVDDNAWGDRHLDMADDELSALLAASPPFSHPPGTVYEYSNLGYAIAGRAVANAAGEPFATFATRTVLAPLGMTDSAFEVGDLPPARVALGYRVEDGGWREEPPLSHGAFGAMGGLWTTVADFSRYVAFHLSAWPPRDDPDTGPLRRASVRELAQVARAGLPGLSGPGEAEGLASTGYGLGLACSVHPRLGQVVSHSGGLPGYGARVAWLPDAGVGLVGFANRTYAPVREAVAAGLDRLADTGALEPRHQPPSPALVGIQEALARLYERWDDREAAALAADNLFQDRPAEARAAELGRHRRAHGRCTGLGEVAAQGALAGTWRMACERGELEVHVRLSPTLPPRLQVLSVAPVEALPR